MHERCGTNLAVSAMLTGLSAMAVAKMRSPYGNANNVILASTAALVLARPLGLQVQRYVTTQTPKFVDAYYQSYAAHHFWVAGSFCEH